jgi:cation:H+ antiporter
LLVLWAKFIGLLFIISLAAHFLSVNSEKIAKRIGANFTGSVILGLITTLPEYLFVVWACIKSEYNVAIGSAVGAAAMLVTLGYGLVILVSTTGLSKKPVEFIQLSKGTKVDSFYLNFTALLALVLAWLGGGLSLVDGILLVACFGIYIFHAYETSRKVVMEKSAHGEKPEYIKTKTVLMLALGAVIIIFASEPFVDSMI